MPASRNHLSGCLCSSCHLSSKIFPRKPSARIILPAICPTPTNHQLPKCPSTGTFPRWLDTNHARHAGRQQSTRVPASPMAGSVSHPQSQPPQHSRLPEGPAPELKWLPPAVSLVKKHERRSYYRPPPRSESQDKTFREYVPEGIPPTPQGTPMVGSAPGMPCALQSQK
ncbi:hypothetical protein C8R44DRAFT_980117 [Mycena epipterygia]|nr:hypothetical protein C8R44DRAFT_980117 [Mycena epipterygia]